MHGFRRNLPVYQTPHWAIYAMMAGAVALTVLALWILFNDAAGTTLSLIVVTGFAIAFVTTPYALWRASRGHADSPAPAHPTFSEWLEGDFEADNGVIGAKQAMAMILLLPAAGAIGLIAVSFIAHLAAVGAL